MKAAERIVRLRLRYPQHTFKIESGYHNGWHRQTIWFLLDSGQWSVWSRHEVVRKHDEPAGLRPLA